MDSGNSGSMQSSSGGDEEYDSRSESISAAFMNSSGGHLQQPLLNPSLHHHLNQTHHQPASLDPSLSNYLDPFTSFPPPNANPLINFDMVWARGMRSETNCTVTGHALLGSSSASSQLILGSNHDSDRSPPLPNPSSMPLPQAPENGARVSSVTSDHQANNTIVRNSKKRSRASRRAPTTVLTTDTSNFRAMVQEFTGIPAPPFSSSSPFSARSRLDLFRSPLTTMRSGATTHFEPSAQPPYLSRPFAQKVHPPPFVSHPSFSSSNSMADGIASTSNVGTNTASSSTSNNNPSSFASTSNYQLLSELGLPKQTQNLLNMQNPILTFQSLLNSSPPTTNYPLPNVPPISSATAKSQGLSTDSHLKMGLLEELDMNHHGNVGGDVGGLPNLIISDGMSLRMDNNSSSRWGTDGVGLHIGSSHQVSSRSFNANYGGTTTQQVNACSSSDFHAEKASDQNVSSRGEGMVDSWICSSD